MLQNMPDKKRRGSSTSDLDNIIGFQINSISDRKDENCLLHHTDDYESDALVIRRGQKFVLDINLKQGYNNEVFHLEFQTGHKPSKRSGTLIKISQRTIKDDENDWFYEIEKQASLKLALSVNVPSNALVSRYLLTVVSQLFVSHKKKINEFVYSKKVFILFNPWCKDDEVYMESEELKNEYILNDTGVVYWSGQRPKPWFFGQFTDAALQCTFNLLEKAHTRRRDSCREVCRHLSAMANSFDENGLLTGNWSGDYSDGAKPWEWQGSVKIFKEYLETGSAVKYGQCWVFSGLITSMMRTLGIPARSVTNYDSAHDTDNNGTFDKYFDEEGKYLVDDSDDSCWNFHVWNDVWMIRPDLPDGMGGWQALDGTPQEKSRGTYRCGPASLQAIKEGYVHYNFDTKFIFAEVNADEVYWQRIKNESGNDDWKPIRVKKNTVGHYISTKQPLKSSRQDVTIDYKYPEGSVLERASVRNALRLSKNPIVKDQPTDVQFRTSLPRHATYPTDVEFTVNAKNTADKELTLNMMVTAQLVSYTGVIMKTLPKKRDVKRVAGKKEIEIKFDYLSSTFVSYLDENVTLRLSYMSCVEETNQIHVGQKVCDINKPTLKVQLIDRSTQALVKAGEEVEVQVIIPSFPGYKKLTDCKLEFDGSAFTGEIDTKLNDLVTDVSHTIMQKFFVKTNIKRNTVELDVTFNSKQLSGITGSLELKTQRSS